MADRPVTMYVRQEGEDRLLDMQVETSIGPKPFQVFKRFGEGTPPPTPGAVSVDSLLSANPFYVAHRCGGANWPEFSEPGILGSLAQGYQALEVSVYRCSTGEFVCSHDWTTTRMTGVSHEIWQTPWSTLAGLTSTAQYTTNPSQPRTPLLRLSDVMALAPNAVIFIDHKATSGGSGNTEDFASMNALLDYMDTFPNSTQRFVWKVFRDAWQTAVTARDRGYRSWGIYYADEVATPNYVEHFDILGQEHNAPASSWSPLLATGKRVMGHIITTPTQRDNAVAKGATGIMNSAPLAIPVSPLSLIHI